MMTPNTRVVGPAAARAALALAAGLLGSGAAQSSIPFSPLYADTVGTGTGADAVFVQIDPSWRGSTVLWDEPTKTYGHGVAIGPNFPWGTGIWGRADWNFTMGLPAGDPLVVGGWSGLAPTINYGNACYNANYSGTWGAATPLPFDAGSCGTSPGNWAARFGGFIRITDADDYNFSVLFDDGFFFRLTGAGGQTLEIGRDFLNPRDRVGFDEDLALTAGLYGFELGAWNRLEAGVVDLRWRHGDRSEWDLVPTEHLVPEGAVPEPATLWLLGIGAAAVAWGRRRRREDQAAPGRQ